MWYIRRTVKKLIDTVSAVRFDNATPVTFSMLLDDVARFLKSHSRLDDLDSFVKTLACCFDDVYRAGVCQRFWSDVVCFIQISVKATVVKSNIDVEDVAVQQYPVIRYAVAYYFIW